MRYSNIRNPYILLYDKYIFIYVYKLARFFMLSFQDRLIACRTKILHSPIRFLELHFEILKFVFILPLAIVFIKNVILEESWTGVSRSTDNNTIDRGEMLTGLRHKGFHSF